MLNSTIAFLFGHQRRDEALNALLQSLPHTSEFQIIPVHAPAGVAYGIWHWFKQLRSIMQRAASPSATPSIWVTADPQAHIAACVLKALARQPMIVIRYWPEAQPVRKRWWTKAIFRRLTDLHWTEQASIAQAMECGGSRTFEGIPSFYRLDHPAPEASHSMMMAECFRGLLGTRQHLRPVMPMTVRDRSHIQLTYITHFYFNQDRSDALTGMLQRYAAYAPDLLDRIQFVIVDDGSPVPCPPPDVNLNLTWLRINEDIAWNMPGARNLGALYASADNLVFTDLDHEFPEATLRALAAHPPLGMRQKSVRVRRPDGSDAGVHPNIFLISRRAYAQCWGYDEEYAGAYGMEDHHFNLLRRFHGVISSKLPPEQHCIERTDINRKTAYHSLNRHWALNLAVDARKRLEISHYGATGGQRRSALNFTWQILAQRLREIPTDVGKQPQPGWSAGWRLRQLRSWLS